MCRQKRRVADDDQEDLLAGDRHAHEGGFVDEPSELSTYCVENDELPLLVDVARYEVYAVLQELVHDHPLPKVCQHELEGGSDDHALQVEGLRRRAMEGHTSGAASRTSPLRS